VHVTTKERPVCDRLRSAITTVINNSPGESFMESPQNNESGPSIDLHQPLTLTQPPSPSAIGESHFITNLPTVSHHLHRHSNFSAWRSPHTRLHSHQISAASHVILRRDMPSQPELQACPPDFQTSNTRGSSRKPDLARPMPAQEIYNDFREKLKLSRLGLFPYAGINSDEHTFLNTTTDHHPPQEKDMKSKPPTPHTAVPDIRPSLSGTQSPRHPIFAASCIGQR
jgi:hypothetical protein